ERRETTEVVARAVVVDIERSVGVAKLRPDPIAARQRPAEDHLTGRRQRLPLRDRGLDHLADQRAAQGRPGPDPHEGLRAKGWRQQQEGGEGEGAHRGKMPGGEAGGQLPAAKSRSIASIRRSLVTMSSPLGVSSSFGMWANRGSVMIRRNGSGPSEPSPRS